ncbi:hypothetical protein FOA43_001075 [Brettanomyces nanus]|uniref:Kinetochore protein Spc24 n=1 Tax=Eeniella nana TaxID=13502 RepID=A0A875RWQ8_EENNA|nr:uncharacterized protein FOA43_001075 [Brettanomyces nanus]QPG73761.1 hypothetical protein FOA43_001075 [Brettanomyces nanus]
MDSLKTAITETNSGFDIQNDLNLLDSIANNIQQLDTLRQTDIEARRAKNNKLTKQLSTLSASINQLKGSNKMKTAQKQLIDLENQMFHIAGNLTTFNMELNSLKLTYNQELKRLDELENQLQEMKNSFELSEDIEVAERAKMIKLKLYESLGMKLDIQNKQVMVLNKRKNKSGVLKLENYSEYFISNYIWDNI